MAGATTTGAVGREAGRRDDVVRQAVGHGRHPARRRGRHEDRVGRVRGHDVPDAAVGQQLERVEHHRPSAERLERQRSDELGRGVGHQDLDLGPGGDERAHQLGGLVGRDRARDPQQDEAALERLVRGRAHQPTPTRAANRPDPAAGGRARTRSTPPMGPSSAAPPPVSTTVGRGSPPSSSVMRATRPSIAAQVPEDDARLDGLHGVPADGPLRHPGGHPRQQCRVRGPATAWPAPDRA